jgi:hypothetical protein
MGNLEQELYDYTQSDRLDRSARNSFIAGPTILLAGTILLAVDEAFSFDSKLVLIGAIAVLGVGLACPIRGAIQSIRAARFRDSYNQDLINQVRAQWDSESQDEGNS